MTPLVEAIRALGLQGEFALAGRWVKLQGERCGVYIAEGTGGGGYYTWCDDPVSRAVEFYRDPAVAILAGLRRGARRAAEQV